MDIFKILMMEMVWSTKADLPISSKKASSRGLGLTRSSPEVTLISKGHRGWTRASTGVSDGWTCHPLIEKLGIVSRVVLGSLGR